MARPTIDKPHDYVNSEHCKACRNTYERRRYASDPKFAERKRENTRKRDAKRNDHAPPLPTTLKPGPNCDCCGKPFGDSTPCLDHHHGTGFVRGYLCDKCNKGLGLLGDTLDGISAAYRYLQRARSKWAIEQSLDRLTLPLSTTTFPRLP